MGGYIVQQVVHLCPAYLKDSRHFLNEVKNLEISEDGLIVTLDTKTMYANINTDHAIETKKTLVHPKQTQTTIKLPYITHPGEHRNTNEVQSFFFWQLILCSTNWRSYGYKCSIYVRHHILKLPWRNYTLQVTFCKILPTSNSWCLHHHGQRCRKFWNITATNG